MYIYIYIHMNILKGDVAAAVAVAAQSAVVPLEATSRWGCAQGCGWRFHGGFPQGVGTENHRKMVISWEN